MQYFYKCCILYTVSCLYAVFHNTAEKGEVETSPFLFLEYPRPPRNYNASWILTDSS